MMLMMRRMSSRKKKLDQRVEQQMERTAGTASFDSSGVFTVADGDLFAVLMVRRFPLAQGGDSELIDDSAESFVVAVIVTSAVTCRGSDDFEKIAIGELLHGLRLKKILLLWWLLQVLIANTQRSLAGD